MSKIYNMVLLISGSISNFAYPEMNETYNLGMLIDIQWKLCQEHTMNQSFSLISFVWSSKDGFPAIATYC